MVSHRLILTESHYSSLNDPNGGVNIDERRAFVAAAQGEVTHFSLNPALIEPVAAAGDEFVKNFHQHRFVKLLPVLRAKTFLMRHPVAPKWFAMAVKHQPLAA